MNEKYNILFLASWYPNKTSPQAGNFIQKHAQSVASQCNVFVLHVVSRVQDEEFVVESETINGVFEVVVYYKKITSKIPLLSNYSKFRAQLIAYNKGFSVVQEKVDQIDLVHLNVIFPAGIYALHLKNKLDIPFVITEHWTAFLKSDPNKIGQIEKYYIKKIANKSKCICPVSEDLKTAMIDFGINNTYHVIPNVVDVELFKAKSAALKNGKVGVLHLSNLKDEHKNITGILHVIQKLSEKRNDFVMTIAGNGDIEKFRKKANELGISSEVLKFEGEKSSTEVAESMAKNDLFVLFSNYENLPCVISESLVAGLPVIATDVGGISEMLNPENGIIIKPGDEDELLEKMNEAITNINRYDRTKIAENASKIYGYEVVGDAYFNLYKKVLN